MPGPGRPAARPRRSPCRPTAGRGSRWPPSPRRRCPRRSPAPANPSVTSGSPLGAGPRHPIRWWSASSLSGRHRADAGAAQPCPSLGLMSSSATPQFAKESDAGGRFVRQQSRFREWVGERPEPGRYHLYVSLACPWASRTVIVRQLMGLEDVLPMTILDPVRDERGWRFAPDAPDPINGFAFLREAYVLTDPSFDARVTVPVLFDTQANRIVNNESADIVRMLNAWAPDRHDLYPEDLRTAIDEVNDHVYA